MHWSWRVLKSAGRYYTQRGATTHEPQVQQLQLPMTRPEEHDSVGANGREAVLRGRQRRIYMSLHLHFIQARLAQQCYKNSSQLQRQQQVCNNAQTSK